MILNKSILENVIKSGNFSLSRVTEIIERGYMAGDYTEEDRLGLLALRDQYLNPTSQTPELVEVVRRIEEKYAVLEARVAELEKSKEEEPEPGEEGETYEPWEPWDGISNKYQNGAMVTHIGYVWVSDYPGQNTWEPGSLGTERIWVKVKEI